MAALLGGSVSPRGLARSVAHRLKYYVDVQRKEDSFDSSGVTHDETESLHLHPAFLMKQKENRELEHNFAEIKLEASLRAFMGSTEECNRKVQKSPEKQKDLEKLIKKMAQDYIPDRTNEGKAKSTKRQEKLQSTPSRLHITTTPCMAPEVRRLISSASKLIVAATSEASPREMGTPQESFSSPKRKEAKIIPSLDSGKKTCLSSTHSHKDEARRVKRNREGKKWKEVKRSSETSSTSNNSKKSNMPILKIPPKPSDISSEDGKSVALYLQTGQNEAFRKGILRSRTSSAISEYQDKQSNARWNNFSPTQQIAENSAGPSNKPLKIKRQESSLRPTETVPKVKSSPASKFLNTRTIQSSRSNREEKRRNTKYSAKLTAEVISTQSLMSREKTQKQYDLTPISGWFLTGPGNQTHSQVYQKSKLVENSERDWPQNEQKWCDLVSRNPECRQVHFQTLQKESIPGTAAWERPSLESCSLQNLRSPEDATQSIATINISTGIVAGLQEDQNDDHIPVVQRESHFLYRVCQEIDQDVPLSLTMNRSTTTDGNIGNQSTQHLLDQLFSSEEEGDSYAFEDPANTTQMQDVTLEESRDKQMMSLPSVTPGACRCSELLSYCVCQAPEKQRLGPPVKTATILERLESEQSEEEFTISSASSSLSARSLTGLCEQMSRNSKEENNTDPSMELLVRKLRKVMPEETTCQDRFCQESKKPSSPTETRRDWDHGTEGTCINQIVYFSHFPQSF
ncbi:uncharacterized protein LOC117056409 isoform X1 [Lacerta agilis]|uniref:uncharacterized protein LOC117056409 isoform X1 n=3 Tax=Lacerta agilis TaxID=80427 RepID=UPI0014195C03|nr:uncharacterized protein LOC117056409 isoform X1 [Lacerta agilis]